MPKAFVVSTDSDEDLNWFSEEEFERDARFRFSFLSRREVDTVQRWMRDAEVGSTRTVGKCTEFKCIEIYKGD